jgi:hypothetical protein
MPSNESTEQNVQNSIEETGGVPVITMSMEVSGMTQYPTDKTLSIPDMAADAKEVGDALADLAAEISSAISVAYPVGSIYMTTSNSAPTFAGTWTEILITATWSQLKTGKRGYENMESGDTGGSVHFWLRTE